MIAWIEQSIGWVAFAVLAFVLGNFVRPFVGFYARKKAENLATKEDIAQITKTQEEIKSQISDKMWDRQRQWDLKRDVVLDSVRAMADFDYFISEFSAVFAKPDGASTDEAHAKLQEDKIRAIQKSMQIRYAYQRAHTVADLMIGKRLSEALSAYFQFAALILRDVPSRKVAYDSNSWKEHAKRHNSIILAARKELGNSNVDDLPVIDYDAMHENCAH